MLDRNREIIIIVDDDITNLTFARNNLIEKYDVVTAPSGRKLLQLLEQISPNLILMDIVMPDLDGYDAIQILKNSGKTAHIPVIFLTSKIDPDEEVMGLNLGAVDYITKPFSKELLIKRIELHLLIERQKKLLMKLNLSLEGEVDMKSRAIGELQNVILKTVAELVECRDSVTGGHIERTQKYLGMLVNYLLERGIYTDEISTWDISLFIISSQLHDVGKISVKDDILLKPDKLTTQEFEEMKMHTVNGVDIIRKIEENASDNAFLQYAEMMAGSHHEKWNGSGYPYGLAGQEIPLMGRLMAIVDVYDALTNDRPYKRALSHDDALMIIKEGAGTHFDPQIVEVFVSNEKAFGDVTRGKELTTEASRPLYSKTLSPTIKTIIDALSSRNGIESTKTEMMKRFLKILIAAIAESDKYKQEVAGWDIDLFFLAAQLHDVGKIAVADRILNKTEKLTEKEYKDIQIHVDHGLKIVSKMQNNNINSDFLRGAKALIGSHHERWDGTGYPQGLKGEEIPLMGRLMAIVDVYSALTTDRPHRQMLPHREAVEIMSNGSGTHFDPDLLKIFLDCEKEIEFSNSRLKSA